MGLSVRDKLHTEETKVVNTIDEKLNDHPMFLPPIVFGSDSSVFIHTVDRQRLLLDMQELFMALHLLEHREWEIHVRNGLRKMLKPGGAFVDVGASIGVHSLFAAALVGENGSVLAIEPHPRVSAILSKNVDINGFLDRVKIIQAIVSDKTCSSVSFEYLREHPAMSGMEVPKRLKDAYKGSVEAITVRSVSLDDLLCGKDFNFPLVKIDVEGFEYKVLQGARRAIEEYPELCFIIEYERKIADEVMYKDVIDDVCCFFSNYGFSIYKLLDENFQKLSFSELKQEIRGDYLFVRE